MCHSERDFSERQRSPMPHEGSKFNGQCFTWALIYGDYRIQGPGIHCLYHCITAMRQRSECTFFKRTF